MKSAFGGCVARPTRTQLRARPAGRDEAPGGGDRRGCGECLGPNSGGGNERLGAPRTHARRCANADGTQAPVRPQDRRRGRRPSGRPGGPSSSLGRAVSPAFSSSTLLTFRLGPLRPPPVGLPWAAACATSNPRVNLYAKKNLNRAIAWKAIQAGRGPSLGEAHVGGAPPWAPASMSFWSTPKGGHASAPQPPVGVAATVCARGFYHKITPADSARPLGPIPWLGPRCRGIQANRRQTLADACARGRRASLFVRASKHHLSLQSLIGLAVVHHFFSGPGPGRLASVGTDRGTFTDGGPALRIRARVW